MRADLSQGANPSKHKAICPPTPRRSLFIGPHFLILGARPGSGEPCASPLRNFAQEAKMRRFGVCKASDGRSALRCQHFITAATSGRVYFSGRQSACQLTNERRSIAPNSGSRAGQSSRLRTIARRRVTHTTIPRPDIVFLRASQSARQCSSRVDRQTSGECAFPLDWPRHARARPRKPHISVVCHSSIFSRRTTNDVIGQLL